MQHFFIRNRKNHPKIGAHYYTSSVTDINYSMLYASGIRCVAFDVDGTLTKSGALSINPRRAEQLSSLLYAAGGLKGLLASNSERDLSKIKDLLPKFYIVQPHAHSPKPSKNYYRELLRVANYEPWQIAMVGDRYIQDIWGAKRSGITSVLVAMHPDHSSVLDRCVLRNLWQPAIVRYIATKNI